MNGLQVLPVVALPEIETGTALGELISAAIELHGGDTVVIAQKAVSKAEGRVVPLSSAIPGSEARHLAAALGKDPAFVQLILDESSEVLRAERNVLITQTHHGLVCANAGIDTSNLPEDGTVCLLPEEPDASARKLRAEITAAIAGKRAVDLAGHSPAAEADPQPTPTVAVVIADSFGRAWRLGQAEVAIGCAGLIPLDDWRGRPDSHGRELEATQIAIADEAAGAADLVRGKDSRVPAVVVRGLARFVTPDDGPGAAALHRPRHEDLFR